MTLVENAVGLLKMTKSGAKPVLLEEKNDES
jgi:hypothetical protein